MLVEKLDVFKLAHNLVLDIYRITRDFPAHENWNLISQMRRAACSIPTNIMEGAARKSNKEFEHFLYISCGSCSELEYQIILSHDLHYITDDHYENLKKSSIRIKQKLFGLIRKLKNRD